MRTKSYYDFHYNKKDWKSISIDLIFFEYAHSWRSIQIKLIFYYIIIRYILTRITYIYKIFTSDYPSNKRPMYNLFYYLGKPQTKSSFFNGPVTKAFFLASKKDIFSLTVLNK